MTAHLSETYRSVAEMDRATWDHLAASRPSVGGEWLQLLERVMPGFEPRYLLLREGGEPVAGAVCHLQRRFHLSVYLRPALLRGVASRLLAWRPPLTCGVPVFGAEGLLLHPDAPRGVWMPRLLEAGAGVARREGALFIGMDNLTTPGDHLEAAGHTVLPLAPEAVLDLEATGYEEYEQALPKKKRSEIRRVRNRAHEAGVCVTISDPDPRYSEAVEGLIRQTAEQHGNPYLYRPGLLDEARALLEPSACRLLLAWQGEEIIATVTLFRSGSTGILKWVGLNYERTEQSYAYHLMMTETVRAALEVGVRRLILGATVYTLKKQMGAEIEARHLALRLPQPPLNLALRQALRWRERRNTA